MLARALATSSGSAARSLRIFGNSTNSLIGASASQIPSQVFVRKDRKHERGALHCQNFPASFCERTRGSRVMRAVDDCALVPSLKTCWPIDGERVRAQSLHRRHRFCAARSAAIASAAFCF